LRSTATVTHATPTMIDRRRLLALAAGAPVLALGRTTATQAPPAGTFSIAPGQEFAANSYVHQKLPADAPIDRHSASYVMELDRQVRTYSRGMVCVLAGEAPVYIVGPNQPTCKVVATSGDERAPILQARMMAVPIPDPNNFVVQEGDDHAATIYQPSTKTLWEFWIMQKTGAQTTDSAGNAVDEWGCRWGGRMDNIDQNPGWWGPAFNPPIVGTFGTSGSGLPLIAGYITVNDVVHKGRIEHPIHMVVYGTLAGHWSLPAQRTDGGDTSWSSFPDGAWFRLDPTLTDDDLASIASSELWRQILIAVRDYGMIVRDKGGGVGVYAENPANPAYGGVNPYLPVAPDSNAFCTTWGVSFPFDKLLTLKLNLQP